MATDDQNTDDANTAAAGSTTPAKKATAKKAAAKKDATTPKVGDTNDAGQTYVTIQRDGEEDQLVLKPSADYSTLVYGYGWTEADTDEEQA